MPYISGTSVLSMAYVNHGKEKNSKRIEVGSLDSLGFVSNLKDNRNFLAQFV